MTEIIAVGSAANAVVRPGTDRADCTTPNAPPPRRGACSEAGYSSCRIVLRVRARLASCDDMDGPSGWERDRNDKNPDLPYLAGLPFAVAALDFGMP
jgi:hypothetical protein